METTLFDESTASDDYSKRKSLSQPVLHPRSEMMIRDRDNDSKQQSTSHTEVRSIPIIQTWEENQDLKGKVYLLKSEVQMYQSNLEDVKSCLERPVQEVIDEYLELKNQWTTAHEKLERFDEMEKELKSLREQMESRVSLCYPRTLDEGLKRDDPDFTLVGADEKRIMELEEKLCKQSDEMRALEDLVEQLRGNEKTFILGKPREAATHDEQLKYIDELEAKLSEAGDDLNRTTAALGEYMNRVSRLEKELRELRKNSLVDESLGGDDLREKVLRINEELNALRVENRDLRYRCQQLIGDTSRAEDADLSQVMKKCSAEDEQRFQSAMAHMSSFMRNDEDGANLLQLINESSALIGENESMLNANGVRGKLAVIKQAVARLFERLRSSALLFEEILETMGTNDPLADKIRQMQLVDAGEEASMLVIDEAQKDLNNLTINFNALEMSIMGAADVSRRISLGNVSVFGATKEADELREKVRRLEAEKQTIEEEKLSVVDEMTRKIEEEVRDEMERKMEEELKYRLEDEKAELAHALEQELREKLEKDVGDEMKQRLEEQKMTIRQNIEDELREQLKSQLDEELQYRLDEEKVEMQMKFEQQLQQRVNEREAAIDRRMREKLEQELDEKLAVHKTTLLQPIVDAVAELTQKRVECEDADELCRQVCHQLAKETRRRHEQAATLREINDKMEAEKENPPAASTTNSSYRDPTRQLLLEATKSVDSIVQQIKKGTSNDTLLRKARILRDQLHEKLMVLKAVDRINWKSESSEQLIKRLEKAYEDYALIDEECRKLRNELSKARSSISLGSQVEQRIRDEIGGIAHDMGSARSALMKKQKSGSN